MKKLKVFKFALLSVMALSIPVISASANEARTNQWKEARYENIPGGGSCNYKLSREYQTIKTSSSITGVFTVQQQLHWVV